MCYFWPFLKKSRLMFLRAESFISQCFILFAHQQPTILREIEREIGPRKKNLAGNVIRCFCPLINIPS